jgi:DUF438 domain-containing protein
MSTFDIEKIAAEGGEIPGGLELPEQLFLLTMRELYSNFRNGTVNRERAKREKQRIMVAYGQLSNSYKVVEQHQAINKRLQKHVCELYKCDCPNCRKLINIFIGIDRQDIPEDAKILHAQNEKLRDMVQERSERNAELATTIDRIRWALEKGDIERAKEIVSK